jgi:tripartite-type tricarboxylate transporter receptor subunit TctC
VDIIVGYATGGANDLSSRVIAAYLNKKWGVPVNVINKPGGSSVPALIEVYNSAPDGSTVLGDATPSSSMVQVSVKHLHLKIMRPDLCWLGFKRSPGVLCAFDIPL